MSVRRKTHVLPLDSEFDQAGEPFVAPSLPYEYDALAPVISADTLRVHHLKHHQGYADKLNELLAKSDLRGKSLEEAATIRTAEAEACFRFLPTRAKLDLMGWDEEDIFSHS